MPAHLYVWSQSSQAGAWDPLSYWELQTLLLLSQLAGTGPGDQGLTRSEKCGEFEAVTFPSPHSPPELGAPACPSFASESNQKSSGGLGKGEQAATFSLFPLDVPRAAALSPKWPRLELGAETALRPQLCAHQGAMAGLGALTLPQAELAREGASHPAPAAKNSPDKMAAGQLVLFGSGPALSHRKPLSHGGNRRVQGNSLPTPGRSVGLCNLGLHEENSFICQVSCCP